MIDMIIKEYERQHTYVDPFDCFYMIGICFMSALAGIAFVVLYSLAVGG